jgi:multiple sugar transport system ATP-binding protein
MIAGLEEVTEGEVIIDGKTVNELEPKDRDVAMVFQSYALYPNMNVYENIRFPLKVRKVDRELHDEKVMRASAMVELDDFLHRKPSELSGGQRQRVALARAIVREPTVFLMDEPLSNLDAKLRVSTRAQIKNLQHELRVTTIYVTHDQIEAMTLADRVVVMNAGVIQQIGTPKEIYNKPANSFVASFIGTPAMNLMHGSISNGIFSSENVIIEGLNNEHSGDITLGFRAEDASIVESGGEISGAAFSVELLGDATMVSIKAGGELVSVKSEKNYYSEIGSTVMAHVPANLCLLFNEETGEMIDN